MRERLLVFAPDPTQALPTSQPGGNASAARVFLDAALTSHFDVSYLDTRMRAFPIPSRRERTLGALGRGQKLAAHVLAERVDVALAFCSVDTSFYEKLAMLATCRVAGARTFLSPRSGLAVRWFADSWAARAMLRLSGSWLTGLVTQSESWRSFYVDLGFPAARTHVCPNAVSLEGWLPAPIENERFRFLYLGWMTAEKGVDELVEAGRRLHALHPGTFEVVFAGDGARAKPLLEQREPWARVLGWVRGAEVRREIGRANVLVHPSRFEGSPNAVLEAMAGARAVIATCVGATPELIGETGIVVQPGDVDALVRAMADLLCSPKRAEALGLSARQRVEHNFTRSLVADRWVEILRSD